MHAHVTTLCSPFQIAVGPPPRRVARDGDVTSVTSLAHSYASTAEKMRPLFDPAVFAVTAGLLAVLTELSASALSKEKDCPKGQVIISPLLSLNEF